MIGECESGVQEGKGELGVIVKVGAVGQLAVWLMMSDALICMGKACATS